MFSQLGVFREEGLVDSVVEERSAFVEQRKIVCGCCLQQIGRAKDGSREQQEPHTRERDPEEYKGDSL